MEKEKWSERDGISCCTDVILEGSVFYFPLADSRIKQRGDRNLIISMAYVPFSSPPPNKDTQNNWKIGTARQQRVDSSGSTALRRSLCFHYRTASWEPDEINDGAMDYPAWTRCRVWSMKDTDRVSPGKGILQQRADLKDSSRLKLIEIPFVEFGGLLCQLSLLQCPQSEQSLSLNKQIRLHLGRQASHICMAIISSWWIL